MARSGFAKVVECKHEREVDITHMDDLVIRRQYVYACPDCGRRRVERIREVRIC